MSCSVWFLSNLFQRSSHFCDSSICYSIQERTSHEEQCTGLMTFFRATDCLYEGPNFKELMAHIARRHPNSTPDDFTPGLMHHRPLNLPAKSSDLPPLPKVATVPPMTPDQAVIVRPSCVWRSPSAANLKKVQRAVEKGCWSGWPMRRGSSPRKYRVVSSEGSKGSQVAQHKSLMAAVVIADGDWEAGITRSEVNAESEVGRQDVFGENDMQPEIREVDPTSPASPPAVATTASAEAAQTAGSLPVSEVKVGTNSEEESSAGQTSQGLQVDVDDPSTADSEQPRSEVESKVAEVRRKKTCKPRKRVRSSDENAEFCVAEVTSSGEDSRLSSDGSEYTYKARMKIASGSPDHWGEHRKRSARQRLRRDGGYSSPAGAGDKGAADAEV